MLGIYGGFCGQLLALLVVPTSYYFHFGENINYVIVVGSTAFAAIVTAFIDSCAISFAAQVIVVDLCTISKKLSYSFLLIMQYPESIQAGLQLGIGVSTLIGSIYRLLTKALFPERMLVQSSLLYFYCGAATIVFCLFAYKCLLSLPISKRVIRFGLSPYSEEQRKMRIAKSSEMQPLKNEKANSAYNSLEKGDCEIDSDEDVERVTSPKFEVFKQVLFPLLIVFTVYFSTLALWPPLVTVNHNMIFALESIRVIRSLLGNSKLQLSLSARDEVVVAASSL